MFKEIYLDYIMLIMSNPYYELSRRRLKILIYRPLKMNYLYNTMHIFNNIKQVSQQDQSRKREHTQELNNNGQEKVKMKVLIP